MSELKFCEHSDVTNPKYLVIFLHGYGANGENLLDLAHEFKGVLPKAHFISPNGVQPWEGGFPDSYQWFSLQSGLKNLDSNSSAADIKNSSDILRDFINSQLTRFNLTPDKLFLIGFSQGAMMSLHQGLTASEKIAGVIAFSGKLILPESLGEETLSKPDICLIHGEADPVVPFSNFLESEKILESEEFSFESHAVPNLEHSIDMSGVMAAQKFIRRVTNS